MTEPQLVIRERKRPIWYLLAAAILCLLLSGSYVAGRYLAVAERAEALERVQWLQSELDKYQSAYKKASEDLVMQSQFSEVDSLSSQELTESIKQLQSTQRELESELKFYRDIMAPELNEKGLKIAELVVSQSSTINRSKFKLVLTQVGKQEQFLKGKVEIRLHGKLNGIEKAYSFRELGDFSAKDFQFQFRYFQNIEGELTLPDGFVGQHVIVEAKTHGLKKNQSVRKQVNWTI